MPTGTPEDVSELWERALHLAERGRGLVSPNPVVGALVVRDGQVLGEGWHRAYGGQHAEANAIDAAEAAGHEVAGTTLYVTLEPCAHHGRQPPCADLLIGKAIARVVIGCDDPSEKTSGLGPAKLVEAGIEVEFAGGEVERRSRDLIQDFRKHARTGRPLVVLKMATSLDGRVAASGGRRLAISGGEAARQVHRWRREMDAVAVGSGTLVGDDPILTARDGSEGPQPLRVVFGSPDRLRPDSALLVEGSGSPVLIVAGPGDPALDPTISPDHSVGVIEVAGEDPVERFIAALDALAGRGIRSILLEGGPTLAGVALASGEVDREELLVAPIVIGDGPRRIEFPSEHRDGRISPVATSVSSLGPDLRITSVLREW